MTTATWRVIEEAVAPLRENLRLDGGDLQLVKFGDNRAEFSLSLDDVECAECVLDGSLIEAMVLDRLIPLIPDLESVVLIDPRRSLTT